MGCKNSGFVVGLGIGAAIGALVYHFSRTSKARRLRNDVFTALHDIEENAEAVYEHSKEKAAYVGSKVAAKVADKATEVKDRLDIIK